MSWSWKIITCDKKDDSLLQRCIVLSPCFWNRIPVTSLFLGKQRRKLVRFIYSKYSYPKTNNRSISVELFVIKTRLNLSYDYVNYLLHSKFKTGHGYCLICLLPVIVYLKGNLHSEIRMNQYIRLRILKYIKHLLILAFIFGFAHCSKRGLRFGKFIT